VNRKFLIGVSAGAAVFVLGVAVWTRNPGLYLLSALSAGVALTTWTRSGPR
jgi:hypothetical protein